MPKAIKKKSLKKTEDTEAEVQETLSSIKDTLQQRQKTALTYAGIVLAVLIGIGGFMIYSSSSEKKAKALEYQAHKIFYQSSQAQPANKEDQFGKSLELFRQAYDAKKSPYSLFYIAACSYELGKYDDALTTLKEFTQKYPNEEKYLPLIYQKMAMTYVNKGDVGEAKKTLDALYRLKGGFFRDLALIEHGRLLEKEGNAEEAKKKYQELAEKFPDSPFHDEAKAKLPGKKEG